MGATNFNPIRTSGTTGQSQNDTTGGNANSPYSSSSGSRKTGTGTATGEPTGTGAAGTAKVEIPKDDRLPKVEQQVKKRGRKPVKKNDDLVDVSVISQGIGILNMGIEVVDKDFMLTKSEIEMLATPITSILNRKGLGKVVNESSDYISLVFALLVIGIPRYNLFKQKEGEKKNGNSKRQIPAND